MGDGPGRQAAAASAQLRQAFTPACTAFFSPCTRCHPPVTPEPLWCIATEHSSLRFHRSPPSATGWLPLAGAARCHPGHQRGFQGRQQPPEDEPGRGSIPRRGTRTRAHPNLQRPLQPAARPPSLPTCPYTCAPFVCLIRPPFLVQEGKPVVLGAVREAERRVLEDPTENKARRSCWCTWRPAPTGATACRTYHPPSSPPSMPHTSDITFGYYPTHTHTSPCCPAGVPGHGRHPRVLPPVCPHGVWGGQRRAARGPQCDHPGPVRHRLPAGGWGLQAAGQPGRG